MSRAMNLTLSETDVRQRCEQHGILISAIEPLPQGGTHLVCVNSQGADMMREHYGAHVITGRVQRHAFYRG